MYLKLSNWFYAGLLSYKIPYWHTDSLPRVLMFLVSAPSVLRPCTPVTGGRWRRSRALAPPRRRCIPFRRRSQTTSGLSVGTAAQVTWWICTGKCRENVIVGNYSTFSVTLHTYRGQFDWQNLVFINMHEAEETNLLPMKSHVTNKYSSRTLTSY